MSRPATARLKVNPPLGQLPVLQYCAPDQLLIDAAYQRELEVASSVTLVRRIAVHWDWGLCQPLFVARRADGQLYVVDGQHRLAAARLRTDIWQLPCVVASFATAADEAAAFVALNQQRRPLTKLDLFKAAIAAGDMEASIIVQALEENGLRVASTTNNQSMAPGSVGNIGGLQSCYRRHGLQVLTLALNILARAWPGQTLRYAGSIFPGIAAIVALEFGRDANFGQSDLLPLMIELVGGAEQIIWSRDFAMALAADTNLRRSAAAEQVMRSAWAECRAELFDDAGFDVPNQAEAA